VCLSTSLQLRALATLLLGAALARVDRADVASGAGALQDALCDTLDASLVRAITAS
jgi:hypothetical protein